MCAGRKREHKRHKNSIKVPIDDNVYFTDKSRRQPSALQGDEWLLVKYRHKLSSSFYHHASIIEEQKFSIKL